MSFRLALLTTAMRWVARPLLTRVTDVGRARRGFALLCHWVWVPPYVLQLVDDGPLPLQWISVRRKRTDWVIFYIHGGGYIVGSTQTHLGLAARLAKLTGLQVASTEYRLAPEHPAPSAFEDVKAAYDRLRARGYAPANIILAGDSAGGGLALALLADDCARGQHPAGLFALSPWTDLAMTGASLKTNADREPLFPASRVPDAVDMVLAGFNAKDPRISPLFASFDDPPPVMLQVGQDEILVDDSRRMAEVLRQAGGKVDIEEWPGCPHVWHLLDGYLPEARLALQKVAAFVATLVRDADIRTGSTRPTDS